jgi:3-phosphoglycerate kinase
MFTDKTNISYCSTGGGAFLEFMERKALPSLSALGFKF